MRHALLTMMGALILTGCVVTGEPVQYRAGQDSMTLNAIINGSTYTATVLADDMPIITHHWPPFANYRDEQTCRYRNHDIRSVLRIIKGLGSTNAQVYVWVDEQRAREFFF